MTSSDQKYVHAENKNGWCIGKISAHQGGDKRKCDNEKGPKNIVRQQFLVRFFEIRNERMMNPPEMRDIEERQYKNQKIYPRLDGIPECEMASGRMFNFKVKHQ